MSQVFRSIKGTFDILPDPTERDGQYIPGAPDWRFVEARIHEIMGRYNFREIRTPILEPTELIARGVGQLTDIVTKEMFAFEREDTHYVLRPEVTSPVMRAYLQHHLGQRGGVQKLYYIGPCFRAESPQKGRYRQFHQFGAEVIGTDDARADAEVIAAMTAVYASLRIDKTVLRINTLGDEASRPRYVEALRTYFEAYRDDLSETSRQRLEKNPLRILDTKDPAERRLLDGAPLLIDFIDAESRAHYEAVQSWLQELAIDYVTDPYLVRGLDYYTRTAFELESESLGAQSVLGGGGRYDLLAEELGSKQRVPSIGFAAGMERLFIALKDAGAELPAPENPDVSLVALDDDAIQVAFRLAEDLRTKGLRVAYDLKGRSMKAQMLEANRQNARYTVILGKDELEAGAATVKEMSAGTQETVPFDELSGFFLNSVPS